MEEFFYFERIKGLTTCKCSEQNKLKKTEMKTIEIITILACRGKQQSPIQTCQVSLMIISDFKNNGIEDFLPAMLHAKILKYPVAASD